jgi:NADH-quinone oxidoreductase subunit H
MSATMIALLQVADPQQPIPGFWTFLVFTAIKLLIVFTVYMVTVALLTFAERKIAGWIQDRHGPNRVGWHGILQPAADGLKNIMKEEARPAAVTQPVYTMAPALAFIPALTAWAVIPFAAPWPTRWGRVDMVVADMSIGFLFILALTSLGVYGIVLAGWSSNNKYSLLGGLRSSAQMVSYEIAMGMSLIPLLILAGNVSLNAIVMQQATSAWNVVNLTVAFLIFMVAAFAETNRLPFDLPEAEAELITGYHTEYGAMKFSFFFIAEYANMITASALMATLFFGGWDIPIWMRDNLGPWAWWISLLTLAAFLLKVLVFIFVFMWIRWTLPRFRYDQLMSLGWKVLLPVALAYIVVIAGVTLALDYGAGTIEALRLGWVRALILLALNAVLCVLLFVVLDRGRVISPATSRTRDEELVRLRAIARQRSTLAPGMGD